MKQTKSVLGWWVGLVLVFTTIHPAVSQERETAKRSAPAEVGINVLEGAWVRPDGGYTIAIKAVGADGRLEAMYFNPNPLPFEKAQAVREGTTIRAAFELRAGGYGGSTYTLTYDPASDRLEGIYYQAVAQQKFDVYFTRLPDPTR